MNRSQFSSQRGRNAFQMTSVLLISTIIGAVIIVIYHAHPTREASLVTSREWAARLVAYSSLQSVLIETEAAASKSFHEEPSKAHANVARMLTSLRRAVADARGEALRNTSADEWRVLAPDFARLERSVGMIDTASSGMIAAAEAGDLDTQRLEAGSLDRAIAEGDRAMRILLRDVERVYRARLQSDDASHQALAARDETIEVAAVFALVLLTAYALLTVRRSRAGRERRRFVAELTRSEAELRQANLALAESRERLELAARATRDTIWDWDMRSDSVWRSEVFHQPSVQASSGDVHLSYWTTAIHPDDLPRVTTELNEVIESGGEYWSDEYRYRRADGTYKSVLDRGYIVREAGGAPVRMIGAMMDITEQRQAQAHLADAIRQKELILNSAADGIFGIDRDGLVTFANQAAAWMFGYAVDEIVGRPVHDLVFLRGQSGELEPAHDCPSYRTARDGISVGPLREVFWTRQGERLEVEFSSRALRDDNRDVIGAVVTFNDISERAAIERMKNEFVSMVSHELRTPLTSIRGALGLLASGRAGEIPEKANRMLEIATANTERLVRLINDILDIERIDSGRTDLSQQRCETAELIRTAVDGLRPVAEKAGITVLTDPTKIPVWGDPDRLLQTLTNLLGNALKFSPAGSAVFVAARAEGEEVVFEVRDQGRGIPADKLEAIFERFQQIDASDAREKGGSGLGLAICRSIVRQHGGRIWVESEVGRGSRFFFTVPRAYALPVTPPRAVRPLVMVCDDDAEVREVLAAILDGNGYEALTVASGEELLAHPSTPLASAVLLDIIMPGMSGWQTLAALRLRADVPRVPVLITSVVPPEREMPEDVAGWVRKPLEEETIVSAIERAIGNASSRGRVLLVEDDVDLARVIVDSFQRYGIETLHAATGKEALAMAARARPDLLVLDLILPDLDGFDTLTALREQGLPASVPLVVYSAMELDHEQRNRLRGGPTEFLTKSRVSPEEFETRVLQLLGAMLQERKELTDVA